MLGDQGLQLPMDEWHRRCEEVRQHQGHSGLAGWQCAVVHGEGLIPFVRRHVERAVAVIVVPLRTKRLEAEAIGLQHVGEQRAGQEMNGVALVPKMPGDEVQGQDVTRRWNSADDNGGHVSLVVAVAPMDDCPANRTPPRRRPVRQPGA